MHLSVFPKIAFCFVGIIFVMTQLALFVSCLGLLYEHIGFALSNTTKIEVLGLRESNTPIFSHGLFFNIKQFFRNYHTAFLPIHHSEKHEGVFYPQRGQDPEYCEVTLKISDEKDEEQSRTLACARKGDLSKIIEILPDPNKEHREVVYIFNVTQFSEKNFRAG